MIFIRIALAIVAIAMIVIGIVATIAPTPFGFVLVILGFLLLAASAPGLVRRIRRRWRWLDRRLDALEPHLPAWIAKRLKETEPPDEEEEDDEDDADAEETSAGANRRPGGHEGGGGRVSILRVIEKPRSS